MQNPTQPQNFVDIDNPIYWLHIAQYFNQRWHKCVDVLHLDNERQQDGDKDSLTPIMRDLYEAQKRCFLTQKTDALIQALHIAYHHYLADSSYQNPLWLYLDKEEQGHDGMGEFFRLTVQGQPKGGCHLPKDDVYRYLTASQLAFFDIKSLT